MTFTTKTIGETQNILVKIFFKSYLIPILFTKYNPFVFIFRVQCLSDLTQLQQHGGSGRLAQIAAAKSTEVLESPSGRSKLKRDSFLGGKMDDRNRSTEQLLQEKDDEIRKMQLMLQQMQSKLENQNYN